MWGAVMFFHPGFRAAEGIVAMSYGRHVNSLRHLRCLVDLYDNKVKLCVTILCYVGLADECYCVVPCV